MLYIQTVSIFTKHRGLDSKKVSVQESVSH